MNNKKIIKTIIGMLCIILLSFTFSNMLFPLAGFSKFEKISILLIFIIVFFVFYYFLFWKKELLFFNGP